MDKQSRKKLIGFDMDGVLIDHTEMKIKLAARYGVELTPEQTSSDIIGRYLPQDVRKQFQEELYHHPVMSYHSPLMSGAKETLRRLKGSGLRVVLISRRRDSMHARRVLLHHGLLPDFFSGRDLYFVESKVAKNEVARQLGVTHFVDDERAVLDVMPAVSRRYLFDKYGVSVDAPYPRLSSLPELVKEI